jgi:hypothetical protein
MKTSTLLLIVLAFLLWKRRTTSTSAVDASMSSSVLNPSGYL